MDKDTIALFEGTPPQVPSEIAADILNSTTTALDRFDCDRLSQVEDYSMCDHFFSLYQNLETINKAVVELLSGINVTQAVIVYDVLRSKQVSNFLDLSSDVLKKYQLIYLNFGRDSQLTSHSLQDLRSIWGFNIKTVILFVDFGSMELIMDIVNLYCSCATSSESMLWVLPLVNSTRYNANPLDKVVALRMKLDRGKAYKDLLSNIRDSADFMEYDLPESAALLHDAIMLAAAATEHVISNNQWALQATKGNNGLFPNRTANAGLVREAMSKVSIQGLTGSASIKPNGERNQTELEILMLQKDTFERIGTYTTAGGATITGNVKQNRPLSTTEIAHKTLRVVAIQQEPFVFINQNGGNDSSYNFTGYSFDLLTRLSTLLNFKFTIHRAKGNDINSLIQELADEKADVALNPLVVSASRQKSLSFTKPFMHFSVGLLVKKQEEKELDLTQFMSPFTIPAWLLLISSCIVVTLIVYVLDKHSPYGWRQTQQAQGEDGDEFSLFNSLWFCLACMLAQGADNTPRNLSGRILAGCYWFCVLIWNATYTANLASFLVLKNSELPVASLNEAVAKNYDMILLNDSAIAKVIESSKNSLYKEVWEKATKVNAFETSHSNAVQRVRDGEKQAFIAEEPFLNYHKGRKKCILVTINNVLQPMSFAFGLPLSSKYTHAMSLGILRLQEQGVTDSFERKWWEYQNQCPKETNAVSQSRLDVKEMLGVYLVLSAGIVISVIMVGVEIWWKKSLGKKFKAFVEKRKRKTATKIDVLENPSAVEGKA
eukprot:gene8539-14539_t